MDSTEESCDADQCLKNQVPAQKLAFCLSKVHIKGLCVFRLPTTPPFPRSSSFTTPLTLLVLYIFDAKIYSSSSSSSTDLSFNHHSPARRRIGLLTSSAAVRFVVPSGPLAAGAVPVPPVRSTATLTPAGPQGPEVPTMLQRVTFFVASLEGLGVGECFFICMDVCVEMLTYLVIPTVKPLVKTCLTQPS